MIRNGKSELKKNEYAKLRKNQNAWREEKLRNIGRGFYQRSRNEKEKSLPEKRVRVLKEKYP